MKLVEVIVVLIIGWSATTTIARSGPNDSLTVGQAVALTLRNHPAVRRAEYGLSAAGARVDVSRSDRNPDISLDGSYARIGPVPSFDLPGQGTLELAPHDNYDFHVGLSQTLYDFGKTNQAVQVAETSRKMASDNIDLVKFNLAYQTVGVFYRLMILQRHIEVLDEQINTLNQHLAMSVKKIEAGTATDFDSLTIQVRIAVAQSDRIDAVHSLETSEIQFRQLTGLPAETPVNLRGAFVTDSVTLSADSLVAVAEKQRPELVVARDAENTAEARSQLVSLGDKPKLALNVMTGFKNGYEPDLAKAQGNYSAGVEVKVPVFNGHKTRRERAEADANFNSARAHTADLERQVQSEVRQAVAGVNSSLDKIASTQTQVRQAQEALAMARVRYDAGVATNLDLLDAETTLSQAKLIHLRALYDYTVSLNALDRATGKRMW